MCAQTLRSYFETERQQQRALDAYSRFAGTGAWKVKDKLGLYEASQSAFNPSLSTDEAFRYFQRIYDELAGYWQVFRPSSPAVCWPARQIFETIKREFSEFSRSGPINLLNFLRSGTGVHLESCLGKMQGIKPKKSYPIMTVSKFLHFYDPGLFPIYDTEIIWNKVFMGFRNDFREFCEHEKTPQAYESAMKEDRVSFLRDYMRWASSLLSVAPGTFMPVFVDWLDKEPGTELSMRGVDFKTLYAAAFEFTAIGAAMAS
jgi:hypothetical protein